MYICEIHGELDSDWCDECQKIVECDCSNQSEVIFKDLIYDCDEGERTVSLRLQFCETCGLPIDAGIK